MNSFTIMVYTVRVYTHNVMYVRWSVPVVAY